MSRQGIADYLGVPRMHGDEPADVLGLILIGQRSPYARG